MNNLKCKIMATILATLFVAGTVQGQLVTNTTFTTVGLVIPDANPTGRASSTNLSGIAGIVSSVTVTVDITGGFNGDLYAYLAGPGSGFSVLLNRVGVTNGNAFGYSDAGFQITFAGGNPNIHTYGLNSPSFNGGGQLTGSWAPDGRENDPLASPATFDATAPTANLSSFVGNTANGTWTLFVSDLSGVGNPSTLVNWGLTVVTVPEPQTWILIGGGAGLLLTFNRRRKL